MTEQKVPARPSIIHHEHPFLFFRAGIFADAEIPETHPRGEGDEIVEAKRSRTLHRSGDRRAGRDDFPFQQGRGRHGSLLDGQTQRPGPDAAETADVPRIQLRRRRRIRYRHPVACLGQIKNFPVLGQRHALVRTGGPGPRLSLITHPVDRTPFDVLGRRKVVLHPFEGTNPRVKGKAGQRGVSGRGRLNSIMQGLQRIAGPMIGCRGFRFRPLGTVRQGGSGDSLPAGSAHGKGKKDCGKCAGGQEGFHGD